MLSHQPSSAFSTCRLVASSKCYCVHVPQINANTMSFTLGAPSNRPHGAATAAATLATAAADVAAYGSATGVDAPAVGVGTAATELRSSHHANVRKPGGLYGHNGTKPKWSLQYVDQGLVYRGSRRFGDLRNRSRMNLPARIASDCFKPALTESRDVTVQIRVHPKDLRQASSAAGTAAAMDVAPPLTALPPAAAGVAAGVTAAIGAARSAAGGSETGGGCAVGLIESAGGKGHEAEDSEGHEDASVVIVEINGRLCPNEEFTNGHGKSVKRLNLYRVAREVAGFEDWLLQRIDVVSKKGQTTIVWFVCA